jgi:hypothetical protein
MQQHLLVRRAQRLTHGKWEVVFEGQTDRVKYVLVEVKFDDSLA